jgi:hypothetical protein
MKTLTTGEINGKALADISDARRRINHGNLHCHRNSLRLIPGVQSSTVTVNSRNSQPNPCNLFRCGYEEFHGVGGLELTGGIPAEDSAIGNGELLHRRTGSEIHVVH